MGLPMTANIADLRSFDAFGFPFATKNRGLNCPEPIEKGGEPTNL
jgi:hypothetical protein